MISPKERRLKRRKYDLLKSYYQSSLILKGINPSSIPVFSIKKTNRNIYCQVLSFENDRLVSKYQIDTKKQSGTIGSKVDGFITSINEKEDHLKTIFNKGKCKFYISWHSPKGHILKIIKNIQTLWNTTN